jgi:alpha-D-ribose 1-methylphosphonate 5-triphosphate synthase subunit PhnI
MPISEDFVDNGMSSPAHCIDRNWNIVFQFSDITNMSNLLASELDFLRNRVLSEEFANACWDAEFDAVWQDNLECYGSRCHHSLRHYCPLARIIEVRRNSIKCFGRVP